MAYSFEQLLAADPSNPSNIAQNGSITIFAPGDETMTPLTITDPDGSPLPNPFTVNANGFGPAFAHATLDRVAWSGGGFTGFVTSYEGMKQVALDAQSAAENAAATAGAEAAAVATAAIGDANNEATAAAEAAAQAQEAAAASATAASNSAALVNAPAASVIATVAQTKARVRAAIRRANESRVSKVIPPAGLSWSTDLINVFKAGGGYVTDFDVANFKSTASATVIYMDSNVGLDTNAGTEAAPVKAFWKAYELCPAGGTIMVLNKGTIYRNTAGWSTTQIKKTVNIVAKYPGETVVSASDNLTFTLTAGQTRVYQAARTNVQRVVDIGVGETGYEYPLKASIAACALEPGSYYHDGTNVYINTLTGKAPNPAQHLALLSIEQFVIKADTAPMAVYLEGFTIVGGNSGNLMADSVSQQLDVYAKDCTFLYTTNAGSNSVNIHGARRAFFQDCTAAHSRKDGFNYTSYNTTSVLRDATKFIEVNCRAFSHGFPSPSIVGVNNASTAHAGCQGIRIGGTYYETDGAVVADVQDGTKSANYSCTIYDSLATANNQGISAQQSGAEMWVYGCQVFGNTYDLYMVTGTTAYVDSTEYDTKTGGGTTTITNPI